MCKLDKMMEALGWDMSKKVKIDMTVGKKENHAPANRKELRLLDGRNRIDYGRGLKI